MDFRWNEWNIEHVGKHRVSPEEAEQVVRQAEPPYPQGRENEKLLVCGRGRGGRLLQVIYLLEEDDAVYIIHARPLTESEKRRFRRRRRT
jgi:uncharacterized DUF497 family protein